MYHRGKRKNFRMKFSFIKKNMASLPVLDYCYKGSSCKINVEFDLFDLILYVAVNNLSVMSGQVFLG